QVGGDLPPADARCGRRRERACHQRLGGPRHALEEDVPAGEQTEEEAVEHLRLPHDDVTEAVVEGGAELGGAGHGGIVPLAAGPKARSAASTSRARASRASSPGRPAASVRARASASATASLRVSPKPRRRSTKASSSSAGSTPAAAPTRSLSSLA